LDVRSCARAPKAFGVLRASTVQRFNPSTNQPGISRDRTSLTAELRRTDKETVTRKITRVYLIGMLRGVMIAAVFTYVFAIPAT
jgi:hypothetical protein